MSSSGTAARHQRCLRRGYRLRRCSRRALWCAEARLVHALHLHYSRFAIPASTVSAHQHPPSTAPAPPVNAVFYPSRRRRASWLRLYEHVRSPSILRFQHVLSIPAPSCCTTGRQPTAASRLVHLSSDARPGHLDFHVLSLRTCARTASLLDLSSLRLYSAHPRRRAEAGAAFSRRAAGRMFMGPGIAHAFRRAEVLQQMSNRTALAHGRVGLRY